MSVDWKNSLILKMGRQMPHNWTTLILGGVGEEKGADKGIGARENGEMIPREKMSPR